MTIDAGSGFSIRNSGGTTELLRVDEATGNVSRNGALFVHTTGSTTNTFVGALAGGPATTDNIFIAHTGFLADSTKTRIGTFQQETVIAGIFGNAVTGGATVIANSSNELGTLSPRSASRKRCATWGHERIGDSSGDANVPGRCDSSRTPKIPDGAAGPLQLHYAVDGGS